MENKKPLVVVLFLLFIGLITWLGYVVFYTPKVKDVFLLIPKESSMVIEITNTREAYDKLVEKEMLKGLQGIPLVKDWTDKSKLVFSLIDSSDFKGALSDDHPIYCSVHSSASREMGLVWYFSFEKESWEQKLSDYLSTKFRNANYSFEQRKYEGYVVHELIDKKTKETWSFIWHKNVLVGSYTGYLVEDVIRLIRTEYEGHFMSGFEQQRQARKIHYDDGNLFVNFARMPHFVGYFTSDSTDQFVNGLASFAETGVYDFTVHEGKWLIHGYTHYKKGTGSYTTIFEGQQPQTFTLHDYIPMNTSACYFWGLSDTREWYRKWMEYNIGQDKKYLEKLKDWEAQHQVTVQHELLSVFKNEMALVSFSLTSASESIDKALLVKTKDPVSALEKMTSWRLKNKSIQHELYAEYYDGHKIHQWAAPHLPYWLCGDLANGFDQVYYTLIQDVLVIGNSVQALKNVIKSHNNQEVWRRNVDMVSRWKDLTASNFSMFVEPQPLKSTLLKDLNADYATALQQREQEYNLLKSVVIQFAYTQDKLYTNVVVENNFSNKVLKESYVFVPSDHTSPIPANAHLYKVALSDNWTEVFYADSTQGLHLVDAKGNAAWRFTMSGGLKTNIASGDFNKDGSSDYMFVASNKIHAISNKGTELPGFPLTMPDTLKALQLSVIDYDRTKNYRIAIADVYGNVFLFDLTGKPLDGWLGKDMEARLLSSFAHLRIGNNDRMLAWNQKGDFRCFNRRAEIQSSFPLQTGQPALSSYFLEKGTRLSDTYIYTVSEKGLKCKFNLEGKMESRQELYRILPAGKFSLVTLDNESKKFYILHWDESAALLLDSEGRQLFRISGNFSTELRVEGFAYGDRTVFHFEDKKVGNQFLYDEKGTALYELQGLGNSAVVVSRKEQSGYGLSLLEAKNGTLRWLKLKKVTE